MNEADRHIEESYQTYLAASGVAELTARDKSTHLGRLIRVLNKGILVKDRSVRERELRAESDLEEAVRERPGLYPVSNLYYGPGFARMYGFQYRFDFPIEDTVVSPHFSADAAWGLRVQREPSNYTPLVEVKDMNKESEDEELNGLTLLHLPAGIVIPVGPIHFPEEDTPMTDDEIMAEEIFVERILYIAGIKVPEKVLVQSSEMMKNFMPAPLKHTDRYFYWQPVLPESRGRISIDFDSIGPGNTSDSWENAPTLTNTITPDPFA